MRDWLRTILPETGRTYTEDGGVFNIADYHRSNYVSIARGLMPGAYIFGAYGERLATTGESNVVIWPNGPFQLPPPAGLQMSIVSTSANDTLAGTGVRQIEIHYLDDLLAPQAEIVNMNGLTPVLTVATNIRFINSIHAQDVGSVGRSVGVITAANGGITYGQINANEVRSSSSARMVPAGKKCFVAGAAAGSSSGSAATTALIRMTASELDNHQYLDPLILMPFGSIATQDVSDSFNFPVPLPFSAGTVIAMTSTHDKASTITGSWFGWVEDA